MKSDLEQRIENLEKKFDDVYGVVMSIKKSLNELVELRSQKTKPSIPRNWQRFSDVSETMSASEMLGMRGHRPNPWAVESSKSLLIAQRGRWLIEKSYQTYEPTIEALEAAPDGLTAGEVGERTGRARNTETAYLVRLHAAGITERRKDGNRVIYKLVDADGIAEIFGEH